MNMPIFVVCAALLAAVLAYATPGDEPLAVPVTGSKEQPALLLELGSEPKSLSVSRPDVQVVPGEVSDHAGDASLNLAEDEVESLHPGFGQWRIDFRFKLPSSVPAKSYYFWARWRQGGDPSVCAQNFEIWAGPDPSRLERRATLVLQPKGWDYDWIAAAAPVALKAGDAVIDIRTSGAGHDAKVFDAFLLGPPPAPPALPVAGSAQRPLLLLELGKTPAYAAQAPTPGLRVYTGSAEAGAGASALTTEADEVQVFHSGFGTWDSQFRFQLADGAPAGEYRLFARYKSGGEVSQVSQQFTVKAGDQPEALTPRARFATTNTTPWQYQWLKAEDTVTLLPGDAWLEIDNTGKADGAKVFDAFLLQLETPLGAWMTAEQARLRKRFLALTKTPTAAPRKLYLLDGPGQGDSALFSGLSSGAARPFYDQLSVSYLVGPKAQTLSRQLNLPSLPAAVISDDHYGILGVIAKPDNAQQVLAFLADPAKGSMPAPPAATAEAARPLTDGVPSAWLVGGLQDGQAGLALFGLDNETVLRPNPGQVYPSLAMAGGELLTWHGAATDAAGQAEIIARTQHDYRWARGSGYAQLYLHTERATEALLHLNHDGVTSAAWLDGQPLPLRDDPFPPGGVPALAATARDWLKRLGVGGPPEPPAEPPRLARLTLSEGWHSLLLKLVMRLDQNQRFAFSGVFTDATGRPLNGIKTQLADPSADLALNAVAARLRPLIFTDAPANLPHPGDPLKLRVDLRWHPILEETKLSAPLPKFKAKLRLRVVDYDGKESAAREITGWFPSQLEVDLGQAPTTGYYAVYASLLTEQGQLIMNYPADGFSVVGGAAAQRQRLEQKKLWNNDYYALADGDNSFMQPGGYFTWLERMGIFKSYGGYPGFDERYRPAWEQARQRGLTIFADSAGDSAWLNDNPEADRAFMAAAAPFTRYFKATNEIDLRTGPEWQTLTEPTHWLARAQREYQTAHQLRADAHYVGASLVAPGRGDWFMQVLQLGLEQYQDAWDVHAYPQQAPRFGEPLGNSPDEDERGVLAVYAKLGKRNRLPFWLGETGAKAMHGFTGRRWQAEQTAKMIAWVNSRSDYLGLAFCIAHEYDLAYGRLWDYSMGHKPGEAALYTASALIDGLPYRAYDGGDANVQAAYFGETLMLWRADGGSGAWPLPLDPGKSWLLVDVVGKVKPLSVAADGKASVMLSGSPVYVLPEAEYRRLVGG